jgi:ubiquitin-protein ligase
MPQATILDPIYHPNIREDGQLCCWRFNNNEKWRPTASLIDFIKAIINLIDNPDFERECNKEPVNEYLNSYEKFYETALQYTIKHGRPRQ